MSTFSQRSFTAGEVGPSLFARVDMARYATGLRTCRNMMVMRHGGVTNRPGTQFIGEVKDSSKRVRLIPFVFNTDQSYVLEFGNLYIRIIQSGAYIKESTKAITAITKANPAVVTSNAHGYSNGDEVDLESIVGMTELNGRNVRVAGVTANTYQLHDLDGNNINSTAFTTYVSGGTSARIYTVTTTYIEAELPDIQHVQSADVMSLAHPSHPPAELARVAAANWTLTDIAIGTGVIQPSGIANSGASTPGSGILWQVVNVDDNTGEDSAGKFTVFDATAPTGGAPQTITWSNSAGTTRVYRSVQYVFGLIGYSKSGKFIDDGVVPDFTDQPHLNDVISSLFNTNNYPAAVGYFQQRLLLANLPLTNPETLWGSRSSLYHNFNTHSTPLDDDPLVATLNSRQVNRIRHLIDIGKLVVFTSAGEWIVAGDANGVITPSSLNAKQFGYNGASRLPPIVIDSSALYVQARGSIVRDLGFDISVDGYRGNDLTVFSPHFVDGYTLDDWAYQLTPHSTVWAVRSDGTLIALTYIKEQQIIGWHRHDFQGGSVESVCCIPEGEEDVVYLVVNRTINGAVQRYVERMSSRRIDDIIDSIFMDSALTYDGRNGTATTMTLSGGTTWEYNEVLTITASAGFFKSTDVGNAIYLYDTDGSVIRFTIGHYTSATVATGLANRTVPVGLRSVAVTEWTKAVKTVTGLWHLEGEDVSVLGDGYVVASPNNPAYDVLTVTNGSLTLDQPYGVIHVGLPYLSDTETLDIDTAQGETVANKQKIIMSVNMFVEKSRGIWAGPKPPADDDVDPLEDLYELKARDEESYDSPVDLLTEEIEIPIKSRFNSDGRVFIRQVDPLPLTLLAISPSGLVPFKGG